MLFENLETGMLWEVENTDRIKELENSKNYTCIRNENSKPIKTSTKKKESK